jgi:hypothetical protein
MSLSREEKEMRTIPSRAPDGRRAAVSFRHVLTLCLGAALLITGCATGGNGGAFGSGYGDLDTPERQCQRSNGVWRPQIANGYCELSR